jgi:hypothetical protein
MVGIVTSLHADADPSAATDTSHTQNVQLRSHIRGFDIMKRYPLTA